MNGRAWVVTALAVAVAGSSTGASSAAATTRVVGPGHPYALPCQAIAASAAGDTVQIDAAGNGSYDGDVCASGVANLTIEGVNGRARIDAAGHSSGGKAIWVLSGAGTVVRDVELSGAHVADRNGAAIRLEGGSLTLGGVFLHDNEDGILVANDPSIDLTIESSEIARNGTGDGQTHNIYVGTIHHFTLRASYSHDARVGHLVKSRAAINDILFNRLTGEDGTDSYELDLPDGGVARVAGNVIEQGPATENAIMLAYGEEGVTDPAAPLTVVGNTFVSTRPGDATAISVAGAVTTPAVVADNIGVGATTFVTQPSARLSGNCLTADARFTGPAYDYHLQAASPCRDVGDASPAGGLPTEQYVYDLRTEPRAVVGPAPDAGAFEWAPPASGGPAAPPPTPPAVAAPRRGLAITRVRVRRDGALRVTVRAPGAGRLTARATARTGRRRVTYATAAARPRAAGTRILTLRPTRAGRRSLRRHRRLAATVTMTYISTRGARSVRTARVKLRRTTAGVRAG